MTPCEITVNGHTYRVHSAEIAAHVRYLLEHEALLTKAIGHLLYYDLVLNRTPAGNGAQVLNKSLPFARTNRARSEA